MKRTYLPIALIAVSIFSLQRCTPDNTLVTAETKKLVLPEIAYDYKADVDAFIKDMPLISTKKRITDTSFRNVIINNSGSFSIAPEGLSFNTKQIKNDVATLGRVLFYDTQLSINNTIACGSCHLQSKAFSDLEEGSAGFKGIKTSRNSMAITNPMLTRNLFWDSRSKSLQDMVLKPVQNHIEMGMEDLNFLATKLKKSDYYPALFKKAFGTPNGMNEGVTVTGINTALMQFLASMVTHNSKFDAGAKSNFSNFNTLELVGKDLFLSERLSCAKCHTGVNFSLSDENTFDNPYSSDGSEGTANIGLNMVYKDNGRSNGKFKIPSLRNIELTAPYMHDGRFKSLEEVIEHYNSGIQAHPQLDHNLKNSNGEPKRMNLTALEKSALIAFLKALTDNTYTTDPKFSNPFKS